MKFKLYCLITYIFFKAKKVVVPTGTSKSTSKVIVGADVWEAIELDKSNTMFFAVEVIVVEAPALNVNLRPAAALVADKSP